MNHLSKIEDPIDEFMGDGAYDTKAIYSSVESRDDEGGHSVTIPPRTGAVVSTAFPDDPSQRDDHVNFVDDHGKKAWENSIGYYRRLLVENAMGRYKGIIGATLRARNFQGQKNEAALACNILNRMVRLGTPLRPATTPS